MSHIATVELEIKDLKALAKAAEALGLQFREGQQSFKWYGRFMGDYQVQTQQLRDLGIDPSKYGQCEHAISTGKPHAYEIGVVKNNKGTYTLLWDFWAGGNGLMEKVAAESDKQKIGIGKLCQEYSKQVATERLRRQGYRVTERVVDGKVKLIATK